MSELYVLHGENLGSHDDHVVTYIYNYIYSNSQKDPKILDNS